MVLKVSVKDIQLANCLNLPHNEKEMVRCDIKDKRFDYEW